MNCIYLKNNEIDKKLWDKTISKSLTQSTYGYSWYLDTVCNDWNALVADDYSIVMPLPITGKTSIYQPKFIPKLGIFYAKNISEADLKLFSNNLTSNIKNLSINLNKFNHLTNNTNIKRKYTYSLDLYDDYNITYSKYSNNIKQIIENQKKNKNYLVNGISPNEIINFFNKIKYYETNKYYDLLRRVLSLTSLRRLSTISAIFSAHNELIGVGIFILSAYSVDLVSLASIDNNDEIKIQIIDNFIKSNSSKTLTLNFELSPKNNIENIISELGASKFYFEQLNIKKTSILSKLFCKKD